MATKIEGGSASQAQASIDKMALRYPYTGDLYRAESRNRIRVERAGHKEQWGYFDSDGRWLEGPLRWADPTFCRFISSGWIFAARSEQGSR
jgi:hypothetical protein